MKYKYKKKLLTHKKKLNNLCTEEKFAHFSEKG